MYELILRYRDGPERIESLIIYAEEGHAVFSIESKDGNTSLYVSRSQLAALQSWIGEALRTMKDEE